MPRTPRTRSEAAVEMHARREVREGEVQKVILALLRRHPAVVWAERMNTGRLGRVSFGFVGCPDIIGQLKDGRFLAVEVKASSGGKLSAAQAAFINRCNANEGCAFVASSIDDVVRVLRGVSA